MPRYFIEVAYMGTNYAGFQVQENANTIQAEVEKALSIYFKDQFCLTGSSRTDAGVHAKQNFFHFDTEKMGGFADFKKPIYHLNAILPKDIVIVSIRPVNINAHCRFDAISRTYEYTIYQSKDPFLQGRAFFYPYKLDIEMLQQLATELKSHSEFEAFSKRSTQVHTFRCIIYASSWFLGDGFLVYRVCGSRFLRGMVKGLVGTMLRCGSRVDGLDHFRKIILSGDSSLVDFSVPGYGLKLVEVRY
ncbi:MAG: tRNA pseudouridine(38-40) synthase TruA [Gloeobacteraceae cyanobacterium ES-bin-316]|nr:tRNA pseudouridine(38-40) synthase TruA [Ferruginibacter sp.]